MHKIYTGIEQLKHILKDNPHKQAMLVCDASFSKLSLSKEIRSVLSRFVVFQNIAANPVYEDVSEGVHLFRKKGCDLIVALGGGSVIDTAKCIKLFSTLDDGTSYLEQKFSPNNVVIIAIPTTAGTGSESTGFAVIYDKGEKQSISHSSIVPSYVILEPSLLSSLPLYQKKCAMLDALCQALESWWSVNSTEESVSLSKQAVKLITENMEGFLNNTPEGRKAMLRGANLAGRAINITQTTAPHAMSYKLTSLYGLSHGHSVALCFSKVWQYMAVNINKTRDVRGSKYLKKVFEEMADCIGVNSAAEGVVWFEKLLTALEINPPDSVKAGDVELLASAINPVRLKNNPVDIDSSTAIKLYQQILNGKESLDKNSA